MHILYKNIYLQKAAKHGVNKQQVLVNKQHDSINYRSKKKAKKENVISNGSIYISKFIDGLPLLVYHKPYSIAYRERSESFTDI